MNSDTTSFAEFGLRFAQEWIDAWNSHDLERILSHYVDDFVMRSPVIALMGVDASGVLKGKENVGAYWGMALKRIPDLHFKLIDCYIGAGAVSIHYEGAQGRLAVETFKFDADRKVFEAMASYRM